MEKPETLKFEATGKTPNILCDPDQGRIVMSGVSVPEDAIDFYVPMKDWIKDYIEVAKDTTTFVVDMHYFNTSTSRILLELFRLLLPIQNKGLKLQIEWVYDEDDWEMKEAGEEYQMMVGDVMFLTSKPSVD